MHRRKRARLAILVFTLWLVGCDAGIQKGYVYDHHYSAPWHQIIPGHEITSCYRAGHEEECHPIYIPPQVIYHPASYELDISSCRRNVQSSECKTNTIDVDEETYHAYPVGSYYGG